MKILTIMSVGMSLIFMKGSHPVSLMIIILAQTMILCLMISTLNKVSWFSYILFLIFLGGLMVLFVYISSLASNEMFYLNMKSTFLTYACFSTVVMFMISNYSTQLKPQEFLNTEKSFSLMYSFSMTMPTTATMIYLLLTLIVVVKMASKYEGPLRNMIFTL